MPTIRLSREVVEKHARRSGDTNNRLICARTGIHEATLSHLFSGRRSPSLEVALLISNAYGTTVNELILQSAA
jgi:transcriptional regulator with XRE-family HTH domain